MILCCGEGGGAGKFCDRGGVIGFGFDAIGRVAFFGLPGAFLADEASLLWSARMWLSNLKLGIAELKSFWSASLIFFTIFFTNPSSGGDLKFNGFWFSLRLFMISSYKGIGFETNGLVILQSAILSGG